MRARRRPGVPTWEEIARDHGGFLYTLAYRLTGNHDDAQDLVQDVLLRVRKGLETYEPGSLKGWLSRITTNAFLDGARKKTRRPTVHLPDEPDLVLPPSQAADEALASSGLPDDLADAIRQLPIDFRSAVVLCDVVGLTYEEIADALQIPVGTVRSRIHRGRSMLRTSIAGAEGGP